MQTPRKVQTQHNPESMNRAPPRRDLVSRDMVPEKGEDTCVGAEVKDQIAALEQ